MSSTVTSSVISSKKDLLYYVRSFSLSDYSTSTEVQSVILEPKKIAKIMSFQASFKHCRHLL